MGIKLTDQFDIYWTTSEYGSRVDCLFNSQPDKVECEARGCIFGDYHPRVPQCYYPTDYKHYTVTEHTEGVNEENVPIIEVNLALSPGAISVPSFSHGSDDQIKTLHCTIFLLDSATVRIKITDNDKDRFEVPVPLGTGEGNVVSRLYTIDIISEPFCIKITRTETGAIIFDSCVGPLLYYNQMIQMSTRRSSEFVYGFGETEHLDFKHDMTWTADGMWARDNGVGPGSNLYGVQPYHMVMEPGTGNSNGLTPFFWLSIFCTY